MTKTHPVYMWRLKCDKCSHVWYRLPLPMILKCPNCGELNMSDRIVDAELTAEEYGKERFKHEDNEQE